MKTRDSGMPEEAYWSSFFDPDAILCTLGLDKAKGTVVDVAVAMAPSPSQQPSSPSNA